MAVIDKYEGEHRDFVDQYLDRKPGAYILRKHVRELLIDHGITDVRKHGQCYRVIEDHYKCRLVRKKFTNGKRAWAFEGIGVRPVNERKGIESPGYVRNAGAYIARSWENT